MGSSPTIPTTEPPVIGGLLVCNFGLEGRTLLPQTKMDGGHHAHWNHGQSTASEGLEVSVADRRGLGFGVVFERVAISAICLIAWWAGTQLQRISESVNELTKQMALLSQRVGDQNERLHKTEDKVDDVNNRVNRLEADKARR